MVFYIIFITVAIVALMLFVPKFTAFFKFEQLNGSQLLIASGAGFLSVVWYELVKIWKRNYKTN